jgi:DNA-binding response OmpR family regulator
MSPQPLSGKGSVALAVDDDKLIRQLISAVLETAGYTVFTAGTRDKALHQLGTIKPTLLLLDVELGKDNGYEVCRTVRRLFPDLDPVIVFVTSRRTRCRREARLSGCAPGRYRPARDRAHGARQS